MSIQEYEEAMKKAFDSQEEPHVFSRNYKNKKAKLISAVREQEKNRKKKRRYRAVAAAVAVALLIPATAYAANRIFHMYIEKEKYKIDVKVKKDNTATEQMNDGKLYAPVKLEYTYLPEGSEVFEAGSRKYYVPSDEGSDAHSVSALEFYKLDIAEAEFEELFSIEYKEFTVNSHQVILIQKDSIFEFDKKMYVIFEDYGYVAGAYLGYGIDEEEALKIAEGIRLTETDEASATCAGSLKEMAENEKINAMKDSPDMAIKTLWYDVEDTITEEYTGYEFKMKQVEVLDNINMLDKSKFWENMEGISEYIDENGNLLKYERQELLEGDGENTLHKYGEKEKIKKKFVYLTWEVTKADKGILEPEYELAMNFMLYFIGGDKKDMMNLNNEKFQEATYFDASSLENNDSHYFHITLGEGETITCHTGYLVDEDMLDKMYINVSYDGGLNKLINICQ